MDSLRDTEVALGLESSSDLVLSESINKGFSSADYVEAAETLAREGADMIGANCTLSSNSMIGLARELRAQTDMPLLFQPNAGQPVLTDGKAHYTQSPEDFAEDIGKIAREGADAVGGCCGTTPEFIRMIREKLEELEK